MSPDSGHTDGTPTVASRRAYDTARGVVAMLAGLVALLSGVAAALVVALGLAARSGVDLPGVLGDTAWSGYLLAWLCAVVSTPFAAVCGAIAGGRAGKAAAIGGCTWLAGVSVQVLLPIALAAGTGTASGGLGAALGGSKAGEGAALALLVIVIVVLPVCTGTAALLAGMGVIAGRGAPAAEPLGEPAS